MMAEVLPNRMQTNIGSFKPTTATSEPDNGCRPMYYEQSRLNTYDDWPVDFMNKNLLAGAGLFYTKKEDVVKCAFCSIELGRWERGDDAMEDHRKWQPSCPFVRTPTTCGNIPMSGSPSPASSEGGYDTCGMHGITLRPNSYPENEGPSNLNIDISKFTIQAHSNTYPQFAPIASRLNTFEEWPVSLKQRPKALAEAGFFYTGKGDQTVCFHCGGGLKNWEESDVPWEQHAKWFPKCAFLQLHKSRDFIREVCSKQEAVLSPEQAAGISVPNAPSDDDASTTGESVAATTTTEATTKESAESPKATVCKICYVKEVGVVFLPCGHMVACVDCAAALDKCAVCRRELEATVRAFLS